MDKQIESVEYTVGKCFICGSKGELGNGLCVKCYDKHVEKTNRSNHKPNTTCCYCGEPTFGDPYKVKRGAKTRCLKCIVNHKGE